ncbi:cytochrome d ubiquinol oxidase subunit II [Saccharothrix violaceirubra]|uniref:Cytochrome d ubiquinol oxidase subunit II n=1 Tax=Saccharothrix violaceirubra TaxID=413306 RepID=A0A7W7T8D0_9PSEU|nr:cytochrome d ubiquinol oxidase subunit II [Saccharothrix violaceirubra]MBB4968410.1 cytochrome d ubiquinol oxidase subunit II [Saccharothrix violaceirubra]
MHALWVVLLSLLTAGYFALAGFDYGVGLLARFVGRDEAEHRRVLRAMTPFFLGNEVWLIAAAGVLFGAFPRLEGELLHAHHGTVVVLLCGLVAFTAAVQLRGTAPLWDVPLVGGALAVAAGWGVLLGDVVGGSPVLWAAGMVALFTLHGAVFLAWRLQGPLRARAIRYAGWAAVASGVFVVLALALGATVREPVLGVLGAVVAAAVLIGLRFALRAGAFRVAFGCSAAACVLPVLTVFAAQDVVTPEVMAHASTLRALSWVALAVIPVALAFQAFTWRLARAAR